MYVNENDHIWEASFWQGEIPLLLVYTIESPWYYIRQLSGDNEIFCPVVFSSVPDHVAAVPGDVTPYVVTAAVEEVPVTGRRCTRRKNATRSSVLIGWREIGTL